MSPENNEQHLNHFRNGTQPYKRYALTVLMLVGVIFGAVLLLQAYPSQPLTDPPEAMHTFEDQIPVEVSGFIHPPGHVFADPVTAVVTIWVDSTVVNPDSVSFVAIDFEPYEAQDELQRSVETFGDAVRIIYTVQLRCLSEQCLTSDGSPFVVELKRLALGYSELGSDGSTVVGGSWHVAAIAGRIDPKIFDPFDTGVKSLDPSLFDADSTPPEPIFSISLKAQQMLVILGAAMVCFALFMLINPTIRLWPEREDPKVFIEQQQAAARLAYLQKTPSDFVEEILGGLTENMETSDALLYHLRQRLFEAGLDDLALRVEILDFGSGSTSNARIELVSDIREALMKVEVHNE